jgi:GNAT superfamily N-acetyltransferase
MGQPEPHDLHLRAARLADAERLVELTTQLGYPAELSAIRRALTERAHMDCAVLVLERHGEVLGYADVGVVHTLHASPRGELFGLVVDERQRSAGLGARLVAAAEDWTRARGLTTLRVRSNVIRGRARAFYERLGYRTVKSQHVFERPLE